MKTNLQCIKCRSKRLWIIDKVTQPSSGGAIRPLRAIAVVGADTEASGIGHFEASLPLAA